MANPTIFIIGAGAIGKALAVWLQLAQRKVVLLRGSVVDSIEKTQLLQVETAEGLIHEALISISSLNNFTTLDGIVVLTNKSYGNEQLARTLKDKISHSPIVLLQNGLGIERPFIQHQFQEIYRCVLYVTSQSMTNDRVRFKPVAPCPVGIEKGNNDTLQHIVTQLNTSGFNFVKEQHIQPVIWKKTIANAVFNSICPLLEIDNGIFHRNQAVMEIARKVIAECVAVAQAKGIMLTTTEVEQGLLQISRSSDGQLISTLQDIRHGRKTEMDTLNKEIVQVAAHLDPSLLLPYTQLLGELTTIKAGLYQAL